MAWDYMILPPPGYEWAIETPPARMLFPNQLEEVRAKATALDRADPRRLARLMQEWRERPVFDDDDG